MRFAKHIVLSVAISLVSIAALHAIAGPFIKGCLPSPSDAYASDWTSIFVIDHIRTSGKWPTGWADLRDEYDRLADPNHYAWTFEVLQQRVWFDWDATLEIVRDAEPPLEVFRLTSGRKISYNGDPNLLIRDYLRTGDDPWRVDPPIWYGE